MQLDKKNTEWFAEFKKSEEYKMFAKHPVAYFSSEYALDSSFPTYAGGLGVLAGDFVREVAMQDFPLVSVGLFYKKAQSILSLKEYDAKEKIQTLLDDDGKELMIPLPIGGRTVNLKARMWQEGKTKVYLLDADVPENDPLDREITKTLYDEDRDIRIKQEIILGIGGFRLLAKLGYHASVYHLNEGHSAFLALELVRHEMEHQHVDFKTACEFASKHLVFTNHTLVPAGQEQFAAEKVAQFVEECANQICINPHDIVGLGISEENPNLFSMTTLSFRLSAKSNAVSKLHLEEARKIWPDDMTDSITNGIFIPRWDKISHGSADINASHTKNKENLLNLIKEQTGLLWSPSDLIFVWARRLVEYKQPLLFLSNMEKLIEISKNSPMPIRIIFSGPTGEKDGEFTTAIKKLIKEKLKENAAFIPNYSLDVAEILTAGADVWLNTPVVGREACGTSGMKAALNGVLSLSTNDGWVHEVEAKDIGWVINEKEAEGDIFSLVEKKIIPVYYEHLKNSEGSEWGERMLRARNLILENFSTTRALREYIEKLYVPTLKQKHQHKKE